MRKLQLLAYSLSKKGFIVALVLILISAFVLPIMRVDAAVLTTGSVTLSDSRVSQTAVSYTVQFSGVTTSSIRCIRAQFSDAATAGSKPTAMDITSLTLGGTSNYVPTPASWTVANNNTTGVASITFATGEVPASASTRTVVLNAVTNGSTVATTYFLQFSTFNNVDCSTAPVDNGTIAFIYTNGQLVTATVDPTLSLTVASVASAQTVNGATTNITSTSTTIPFGALSTATNRIAAQDITIGTNAASGYTLTTRYTAALTSGANTIANHTGTNAAPTTFTGVGTASFGYTTNDATLGTGTPGRFATNNWAAFTTSPLEVAFNAGATSETIRVGYQVGISSTTPAGAYSTTVVYVATPIY